MQARGYGYGPSFQGLREAWRVGDAVYGRAVLPEALSESAEEYGLHPALLDAALHVLRLAEAGDAASATVRCCCRSSGRRCRWLRPVRGSCACVRRWSAVARAKRWRSCSWPMAAGGRWRGLAGLRLREASEAQIREAARSEAQHLYRLDWRPVALSEAGPEALPRR